MSQGPTYRITFDRNLFIFRNIQISKSFILQLVFLEFFLLDQSVNPIKYFWVVEKTWPNDSTKGIPKRM
jgi:hypothetical protein